MSKAPKGSKQAKLNGMSPITDSVKLGDVIGDLVTNSNTSMITSAGLAISGTTTLAEAVNACVAMVNGTVVPIPAATNMSALVGTLPTANVAAWAFYINASGTISTGAMTTPAATAALAIAALAAQVNANQPVLIGGQSPAPSALIGFITVSNASGSNFVGGTTALNAASVTTTYYSVVGKVPFIPVVNLENRSKS
jgi:hypothetical protein